MTLDPVLAPLGLFVLYVAPGLGLAFAVFPEKFVRSAGWEELVEMTTLAVIASVAVTILAGSVLAATPAGFTSSWSAPGLLLVDGGVAVLGLAVGWGRRQLGTADPPAPSSERGLGQWSTLRTLEALASEERRVRRALRTAGDGPERAELESRLDRVRLERDALRRNQEADFAA